MASSKNAAALARGFVICAATAFLNISAGWAQSAPPPLSAYARAPAFKDVAITPDGAHLALLRAAPKELAVEVLDTATMAHVSAIFPSPGAEFTTVSFRTNNHVLIAAALTGTTEKVFGFKTTNDSHTFRRLIAASLDGARQVVLYKDLNTLALLTDVTANWPGPPGDDNTITMAARDEPLARLGPITYVDRALTLSRVDLNTGLHTVISRGVPNTRNFIVNGKGQLAGRIDRNEKTNISTLRVPLTKSTWREVETYSEYGAIPFQVTLPDGRFVREGAPQPHKLKTLVAIDPATGAETVLIAPDKYEYNSLNSDPQTREVIGTTIVDDLPRQVYFDPALTTVQTKIAAHFKGRYFEMWDWAHVREHIVVRAESPAGVPGFYLYSARDDSFQLVGSQYPEITPEYAGDRVALKYKARDGVSIPAYLTTPTGAVRKNLPLVVLVSGERPYRYDATFDWMASFLASRGYAVLLMNTRGYDGYGPDWKDAGKKQWGGLMQTDLNDGVMAMIKAGIADPKRICIVGLETFGGYEALAGATMSPDLYSCAVSSGGLSDPYAYMKMISEGGGKYSAYTELYAELIGKPSTDAAALKAMSPINLVGNVRAPILLFHNETDSTVPIEQAEKFEAKMRAAGKDVRLVRMRDGDTEYVMRTTILTELEPFLAAHLK